MSLHVFYVLLVQGPAGWSSTMCGSPSIPVNSDPIHPTPNSRHLRQREASVTHTSGDFSVMLAVSGNSNPGCSPVLKTVLYSPSRRFVSSKEVSLIKQIHSHVLRPRTFTVCPVRVQSLVVSVVRQYPHVKRC